MVFTRKYFSILLHFFVNFLSLAVVQNVGASTLGWLVFNCVFRFGERKLYQVSKKLLFLLNVLYPYNCTTPYVSEEPSAHAQQTMYKVFWKKIFLTSNFQLLNFLHLYYLTLFFLQKSIYERELKSSDSFFKRPFITLQGRCRALKALSTLPSF